jgi:tryptophan-rich sensory protein
VLLFLSGGAAGKLTFEQRHGSVRRAGLALFLFELAIQPLVGPLLGRSWAGVELFGTAPDPTVLATLGVLLAADRMRFELMIIPLLWCAVTGATLWTMQSPDALLMPAAGLLALGLSIAKARR